MTETRFDRLADARPMIECREVQKHYGDYHALRGIDLTIRAGEFFSLLGPSGCGKTTLLRTIAGFEDISSGAVLIDGKDMERVPANRRPTNMVFQSYAIFPHLSVAENVGFGLRRDPRSRVEKAAAVEEALEMVGLKGYGTRASHALSGGQRQRVALARALILKPKVLLLDEPLSALDAKIRVSLRNQIREIQQQLGITTIFVTHDQEEALSISDRIVVMHKGIADQTGTPAQIYNQPATDFVAGFVGTLNRFEAEVLDAARGLVRVEGAEIALDRPLPAGRITLAARPESLRIAPDGIPAEITGVEFLGSVQRLRARAAGREVVLDRFNEPGAELPSPGAQVRLAAPGAGWLVLTG